MTFSVLLSYREDSEERRRNYEYVVSRWEDLGVEVITGRMNESGPFQMAKMLNRAFLASTGDNVVIYGVDHLPPDAQFLRGVEYHLHAHPWMPLYGKTLELDPGPSVGVRTGLVRPSTELSGALIGQCTGVIAVTREAWKAIGGADERFVGWGYEDTAYRLSLTKIYGNPWRQPTTTLIGLYHPPQPRQGSNNKALFEEYENAPDIREYLDTRGSFL